jgi:hypothetical protein
MSEFVAFVCKVCGRSIKAKAKPSCCYFCGCDNTENISDEDTVKMGLFSTTEGEEIDGILFEFPADIRFHPFSGLPVRSICDDNGESLSDFQDDIMKRVRS